MDFETGKPLRVALRRHPSVRREYLVFWGLLILTSVPYAIAFCWFPWATVSTMLFMGYFQVLLTLARSSSTATSHYIRLLLSGSNPIGTAGGSSLLFGAADAIFDWREDAATRKQHRLRFAAQTVLKFVLTPIGGVLLLAEYAWDTLLLRHPRLWLLKWNELFSLARYHDIICPEKSNDVFYADLAISRYQNDPYLYQWNRLRAMVFELKQYQDDAMTGCGLPASNLLLQSDVAAYQTLRRLQFEEIEASVQDHYADHLDEFPFPEHIAQRLLKSSRPITHYQTMRRQVVSDCKVEIGDELSVQLAEHYHPDADAWKVLRLLDSPLPWTPAISRHITQSDLNSLCTWGILQRQSDFEFLPSTGFQSDWEQFLAGHYDVHPLEQVGPISTELVPDFFVYREKLFVRRP